MHGWLIFCGWLTSYRSTRGQRLDGAAAVSKAVLVRRVAYERGGCGNSQRLLLFNLSFHNGRRNGRRGLLFNVSLERKHATFDRVCKICNEAKINLVTACIRWEYTALKSDVFLTRLSKGVEYTD